MTIEQAADQALLIKHTCEEIAAFMQQPTELVMGASALSAEREGRPVKNVLRDWFRALVL